MEFTNLKRASYYEVKEWLQNELELTGEQRRKIDDDFLRFSEFEIYKEVQTEKVNPLWRLTIFLFPIAFAILFVSQPFKMILTGKYKYRNGGLKWWHYWCDKLKMD